MSGCSTREVSRVPSEANASGGIYAPPKESLDLGIALIVLGLVGILCYSLLKNSKN